MLEPQQVFARNILLWGEEKQRRLAASCVLVAGMGGLGSTVSEILVRAGVGTLILLDNDVIDAPDLNRQIQYTQHDLGKAKVEVAFHKLSDIHGCTTIIPLQQRLEDHPEQRQAFRQYKVHGIADCFDSFASRLILERYLEENMFLVHGGVQSEYGQVTTMIPRQTPLFSELYARLEDSGSALPVCPQSATCIASLMAHEIINNLWGTPKLANTLLLIDLTDFSLSKIQL
ncbi:thiamine biosynthesis protein ThiF [candidate division KSB3 bacterium]|uniref:Thiamine biosynthesis protein ThiF n=1 Tax=candidate division KSB3 bacterium TaxID=2044937 RepID=A0A2G6E616_9BACT|nr:MAG: thiamine biosynthesis protein ThiF [candidate division KSB3 bacterium]